MINFTFHNPTKIRFGKGAAEEAGRLASAYGTKILLHYGGGSIKANGLYDTIVKSLADAGLTWVELAGVKPNPRLALVEEGIRICKEQKIDLILAVGGGCTIDSAKAIALGARTDTPVWDYYLGKANKITDALPVGVVLTIPATGSESSDSSVVTNEDTGLKRYVSSPLLYPRFSLLDPEVTFSMPPYQIACGASDILSHLFERYFTRVDHVDYSDRLIEASIKTVLLYGPMALQDPRNYDVRAEIMWVGTVAHNNLLNAGRIGDWASHDIEHELSGMYDIAHGAGLAIITPAWMKYVYKEDIDRFAQLAVRVFDVDLAFSDRDGIVREMIRRLEDWYRRMGLPVRLSEGGIPADRLGAMADLCLFGRPSVGNFRKVQAEDVLAIYRLASE